MQRDERGPARGHSALVSPFEPLCRRPLPAGSTVLLEACSPGAAMSAALPWLAERLDGVSALLPDQALFLYA